MNENSYNIKAAIADETSEVEVKISRLLEEHYEMTKQLLIKFANSLPDEYLEDSRFSPPNITISITTYTFVRLARRAIKVLLELENTDLSQDEMFSKMSQGLSSAIKHLYQFLNKSVSH